MKGLKRFKWLTSKIKSMKLKTGAEIGTGNGFMARQVLSRNPGIHLIEVAWYPNEENTGHWDGKENRLKWLENINQYRNRTTIIEMPSVEAAKKIDDESLDFVFIDADHSYKSVIQDIRAWYPKVKVGGLVSGHDLRNGFPGVEKAVKEFFDDDFVDTQEDSVWWHIKKSRQ